MLAAAVRGPNVTRKCLFLFYSTSPKITQFEFKDFRNPEDLPKREPEPGLGPVTESIFSLFPNTVTTGLFRLMITPLDFRQSKISSWWKKRIIYTQIEFYNDYVKKKLPVLGRDLAVGHFVLDLGGSVRYVGKPWLKYDGEKNVLPAHFEDGWSLQGIDISGLDFYYENCYNLTHLDKVVFFNASKSPHFDDWCLDFVCGELTNLEILDLTACKNITWRGLVVVPRLRKLKMLRIGGNPNLENPESKFICLQIEELIPGITIEGLNYLEV